MEWRFYGPDAVLITFAEGLGDETFQRSRAIVGELERHPPPGLVEFVPAFTTVLLEFESSLGIDIPALMPSLLDRLQQASAQQLPSAKPRELPVVYDGPDLERVAKLHELTIPEVVQLHSEPIYKVYFLGFAPGFPYLGDLNPQLHTPRLSSPRPRVAAGSVAIGGEHTGIYSAETPGGWNVIGRVSACLFDVSPQEATAEDSAMFLLKPGDRIKFVPVASFQC